MSAPKGNKFWELRTRHGADPIYDNAEDLWNDCVKYFEWVEENPLLEAYMSSYQGAVQETPMPKMRAMTLSGLWFTLGVSEAGWRKWRERQDLVRVIEEVERVIYNQKFTGAAAGLLNANIIARELGLKEGLDHTSKGEAIGHTVINYPKGHAKPEDA
jgi:hypothetical protein